MVKVVLERNRFAHLGLLMSLSALLAEIPKYLGMARLSAYGLSVTLVCQANAAYMSWQERTKERKQWEEKMALKAKEVAVKRDLYLNAVRTKGAGGSYADLRPKPLLTGEQYADTHKMWEKAHPPSRTALGLRGFTKCKLVPGSKEVGNTGFCGLCQRDRYTPLGPNDGKSIEGDWTE